MVWGIDEAWAVEATSTGWSIGRIRIPVGEYKVDVAIGDAYQNLFEIPAEQARTELDVTVVKASGRYYEADVRFGDAEADKMAPPEPGVPTVTDPHPATLPDLAALPAWNMSTRHRKGKDFLTFAASPWNAGPAPLVVQGFRRSDEAVMDAYQYFYDSEGNVVGRAEVGTFEYDSRRGHFHWHFEQFASFSLLDSSGTQLVRSKKQSFCLAPTDPVDLSVEGAEYQPWSNGLGTRCGDENALWVREELDAGWADTYYQYSAGQSFNITDLPNGWYQVEVEVDPMQLLYQKATDNDTEQRLIRLSGKPGQRRVLMVPWHGIEA